MGDEAHRGGSVHVGRQRGRDVTVVVHCGVFEAEILVEIADTLMDLDSAITSSMPSSSVSSSMRLTSSTMDSRPNSRAADPIGESFVELE